MLLAGALIAGGGAATATAKGGEARAVAGTCTGSATTTITAKLDNGRIQVEFDVDQNRHGVRWNWAIARNGATVRTGSAVTLAPSGSLLINRLIANAVGPDRIVARARNAAGQVCTARITL